METACLPGPAERVSVDAGNALEMLGNTDRIRLTVKLRIGSLGKGMGGWPVRPERDTRTNSDTPHSWKNE